MRDHHAVYDHVSMWDTCWWWCCWWLWFGYALSVYRDNDWRCAACCAIRHTHVTCARYDAWWAIIAMAGGLMIGDTFMARDYDSSLHTTRAYPHHHTTPPHCILCPHPSVITTSCHAIPQGGGGALAMRYPCALCPVPWGTPYPYRGGFVRGC